MKFTEQIQFPFSEPFTECAISPRIFTNEWKLNTYRKLLESNPNDNIGTRVHILALRMGLRTDYEVEFSSLISNFR